MGVHSRLVEQTLALLLLSVGCCFPSLPPLDPHSLSSPLKPHSQPPPPWSCSDPVGPIPDCASDTFVRLPCYDFMYTPNDTGNPATNSIIQVGRAGQRGGWLVAGCGRGGGAG